MADAFKYGSPDELIRHIKERADDIDAIWIVFDNKVKKQDADGTSTTLMGVAGVIRYCDGSSSLVHAVDAEMILNDDGIRRLRIPFRLLLPGESLPEKKSDAS
jgi:hypothetical protein